METQKLVGKINNNSDRSSKIQKRVQKAREIQTKRFKKIDLSTNKSGITSNSEKGTRDVKKYCLLSKECTTMMISASATMNLTARSYFKVVKIARTIADLSGKKEITTNHLASFAV